MYKLRYFQSGNSLCGMDCQKPIKNKEIGKWEVWDFAYEENGERYYELHEFFKYKGAIEF